MTNDVYISLCTALLSCGMFTQGQMQDQDIKCVKNVLNHMFVSLWSLYMPVYSLALFQWVDYVITLLFI